MQEIKQTAQEDFLKQMMDNKKNINIFLHNGIKITGKIADFDKFTINIPDLDGEAQLVYKNAISTIRAFRNGGVKLNDNFGNSESYGSMKDLRFMKKNKRDY